MNRRYESTNIEELLVFFLNDDNIQYNCFPTLAVETIKKQVDLLDKRTIHGYLLFITFPVENGIF